MPALGALFWVFALWMAEQTCEVLTELARPAAHADIVSLSACAVLATSLVIFAMVRVHAPDASLRALLAVRPIAPLHLVLAIAVGAGLSPAMSTLGDAILRRWPYGDPEASESMQRLVASSSRVALVAGALVIIPVARELFFRGALFGQLQRAASPQAAVVATTALFALFSATFDLRELPGAVVLGFAFARLRARTKTVVAPVFAHLAFWSVDGIPILRGRDPTADFAYPTRWIVGGAVIAVLALAAVGAGEAQGELPPDHL